MHKADCLCVDDAVYLSSPSEDHLRIIHIDKLWTNPKYDFYVVYFTFMSLFQFIVPLQVLYCVFNRYMV